MNTHVHVYTKYVSFQQYLLNQRYNVVNLEEERGISNLKEMNQII